MYMSIMQKIERFHDLNGSSVEVKVIHRYGRYEILVDGKFYCTCDSMKEVREEINNIKLEYSLH